MDINLGHGWTPWSHNPRDSTDPITYSWRSGASGPVTRGGAGGRIWVSRPQCVHTWFLGGPWGAGSVSHARHVSSSSGRGAMSLRVALLCGCRPPALPAPLTAPVNAAAGRGLLLPTVVAADASLPPCRLTRVGHGGLTSHPSASPRPLVASA